MCSPARAPIRRRQVRWSTSREIARPRRRHFSIDATPPMHRHHAACADAAPGTSLTITGSTTDATVRRGQPDCGRPHDHDRRRRRVRLRTAHAGEGANVFTFVATDRAGNVAQQSVTTSEPTTPPPPLRLRRHGNLVQDPQFDLGESGFAGPGSEQQRRSHYRVAARRRQQPARRHQRIRQQRVVELRLRRRTRQRLPRQRASAVGRRQLL